MLVSIGVTAIIPVAVDMDANTQVLARISPRLVDLIIALAAGFMAALASMRSDIPDALPGVAISASIVPPLCVVGASIYEGAPEAAIGALLLFVANFIAIQVMGAVVYLLMGLIPHSEEKPVSDARAAWYALVAIAAIALVLFFMDVSMGIVRSGEMERRAQDITASWANNAGYRVTSLSVDDNELYVQIAGVDKEPDVHTLAQSLSKANVTYKDVYVSVVEEHNAALSTDS